MKRRLFSLILSLILAASLAVPAFAANPQADATVLNELGLFNGVGTLADGSPDYALERIISRQEAVTMLVRLLGKEQEAKAGNWQTPFSDVDSWAMPYVGYAYANGLTTGISNTAFGGTQPVTATQYLTFVLRALGYTSGTDFAWDAAWEKTDALGITNGDYSVQNNTAFLRGDAVSVSKSALSASLKDGASILLELLAAEGAVTQAAAEASGLMPDVYTHFARELLEKGGEPVIVSTDENGIMASATLSPLYEEYDAYSGHGTAGGVEYALGNAMKQYLLQCVDGDYSDGAPGTVTFTANDAFFLTDTKGNIVAYAYRADKRSHDYTLYPCKVDTKKFMNARVKEVKELFSTLIEVPCDASLEGGKYVYRFSDIPENAVWLDPSSRRSQSNHYNRGGDLERWTVRKWTALQNGFRPDTPVQDTYSCDPFYSLDQSGNAVFLFYFLDASYNLIGYCNAKIPVSR